VRTRIVAAVICTSVLGGCGGSSQPAQKRSTSSKPPTQSTNGFASVAMANCATTFHDIISQANGASDPAWVNDFMASNQQAGNPTVIGQQGNLTATGTPTACELIYEEENTNLILQVLFVPGDTSFNGSSSEPTAEAYNQQLSTPNVAIGANGTLTPLG